MRIAVVGVGLIGALHARIFDANSQCELVAVCDADIARARSIANSLGCRFYVSHSALLESEELDAVSIATPEAARHEPAVAAAMQGLELLLEKPLGRTLAQVDKLIEALKCAKAEPAVNFILHADPRFAQMKQIVSDGQIGRIVTCFARRRGTRLGIEKYAPWTDLLSSTLIHDIEMSLAVNEAPAERAYAEAVVRECAKFGSHDAVVATLRFADGAVAVFETSWVLPANQPEPLDPAFHLVGDSGAVTIEGSSQGISVLGTKGFNKPDMTHWPVDADNQVGGALARSLNAFVDAARKGTPHLVGLAAARRAEAVVAAMKLSIERERPVRLSEL
ncbi:MAG: Gfo/Idh/MocA family oxidoreductase [Albidovulum sp.]|nr:Gfo/Idh/MocA family oxidoreductase [Albidovulum sp.]